jgi:hypothetical protein
MTSTDLKLMTELSQEDKELWEKHIKRLRKAHIGSPESFMTQAVERLLKAEDLLRWKLL